MAKVESEVKKTFKLELTEAEATYLLHLTQNHLSAEPEHPHDRVHRGSVFNALFDAGVKA